MDNSKEPLLLNVSSCLVLARLCAADCVNDDWIEDFEGVAMRGMKGIDDWWVRNEFGVTFASFAQMI